MTSNPQPELSVVSDVVLVADTGPEAITGSTRLKAGTAQKLMLNGFSTALMIRLGRVYSNLMIDMRATNAKLRGRSIELLAVASGFQEQECAEALAACGDIKTALVLLLTAGPSQRTTPERIAGVRVALDAAGGVVQEALAALGVARS